MRANRLLVLGYALTFVAFGIQITHSAVTHRFGLWEALMCATLAIAGACLLGDWMVRRRSER